MSTIRRVKLRQIVKEPLMHLLVIGATIFGFYNFNSEQKDGARDNQVVVSRNDVARLSALWEKQWQRLLTHEELNGLFGEHDRSTETDRLHGAIAH